MTQQQPTQVPGDTHRRPKSGGVMQRQTREARRMMWWANVDLEIHPSRPILLGSHTWADGNGQVRVPIFIFRAQRAAFVDDFDSINPQKTCFAVRATFLL